MSETAGEVESDMDRTDYKILNLLQQDSRITLRSIGEQVGLTPPAVSERIRKMEEDGVMLPVAGITCKYRQPAK